MTYTFHPNPPYERTSFMCVYMCGECLLGVKFYGLDSFGLKPCVYGMVPEIEIVSMVHFPT